MFSYHKIVMKGIPILYPGDSEREVLDKVKEMDGEVFLLRECIRVKELIESRSF